MKILKILTICGLAATMLPIYAADEAAVQTIRIGETDYQAQLLEKRDIGPGTTWRRIRIPAYPLNVNLVTMDMTNPYNRVETFQGSDQVGSTESMVSAAKRLSTGGHKAMAAANGNFWCVSGQAPWSDLLIGTTYGGNMRNSVIITETNNASDMWCGTPLQTCVIGADAQRLWIEPLLWRGYISNDKIGQLDYQQVNKVVRDNEVGLYNMYYSATKTFRPVDQVDGHFKVVEGLTTEVYLNVNPETPWVCGKEFSATVTAVRSGEANGTRGNADICLVGRGTGKNMLDKLAVGDVVRIYSGWTSNETGDVPQLENVMQALSLILKDGVTDPETNQNNSYNNQVYPKTVYGTDKANTQLYVLTIDKSTDPVYGSSAGCPSWVACDILKYFGCWRAGAVDAGGSTQMFVTDRIVNRTTEGNPRAVANGWMLFDTAPADTVITRIAFEQVELQVPVYSSPSPKILGYNKYGTLIDEDVQGITFTCSDGVGTCSNGVFTAASTAATGTLTAHYGDLMIDKAITVIDADIALRLKDIVIDHVRRYPIEVNAMVQSQTFAYSPAVMDWTVGDNTVADIDADGVLAGLENGTTSISGSMGEFADSANVSVEIPDAATRFIALPDELNKKTSGLKVTSLTRTEHGFEAELNVTSTRYPTFAVNDKMRLFGLADEIIFDINPGTATINKINISVSTPLSQRAVSVSKTVTLTPGENNRIVVAMSEFGDTNDLGFYPATLTSLGFGFGGTTGTYNIKVDNLATGYTNYRSGVDDIVADGPTAPDTAPVYYNLQGVRVSGDLAPGLYIEIRGAKATKILVR